MPESALEVINVSKKFRVHHEKRDSIYESIVGWFNKKKYYEDLHVLKNINFSVNKGEMFGIVGKNGTGKTTLLRILAGIYKPDSGKVIVNGSVTPLLSLGVGFNPAMTARDNVIQYGILLGLGKNEILDRIDEIIRFAELEKFEDTKLKNFSSGMNARLAFSTAIQVDPDILLIDEIIQVGDLAFQRKSFESTMSFKKRGKSIILVSHDINSIKEHCDRAMFLKEGRAELIGSPEEVINAYTQSSFSD